MGFKTFQITSDMALISLDLDAIKYIEDLSNGGFFYQGDIAFQLYNDLFGFNFVLAATLPSHHEGIGQLQFDICDNSSDMTDSIGFVKNMDCEDVSTTALEGFGAVDITEGYRRVWFDCADLAKKALSDLSEQLNSESDVELINTLRKKAYEKLTEAVSTHRQTNK